MAESILWELSTDFAVKIIKLCETIKGHYSLVNQLERSATSIGANIHEANYATKSISFFKNVQSLYRSQPYSLRKSITATKQIAIRN